MKYIIITLLVCFQLEYVTFAGEANKTFLPIFFRAGKIVGTELQKKELEILNISPYEKSAGSKDGAVYAVVSVLLDKGRSIGIYDYSLKDQKNQDFPCIAIRKGSSDFDASNWNISTTSSRDIYSLLFKVNLPENGKVIFNMHFNYSFDQKQDIPLMFNRVKGSKKRPLKAEISSKPQETLPLSKIEKVEEPKANKGGALKADQFVKGEKIGVWKESQMSREWKILKWDIPIDKLKEMAGVLFFFRKGNHRLDIKSVSLFINGEKVSQDEHLGYAGIPSSDNNYILIPFSMPDHITESNIEAVIKSNAGVVSYGDLFLLKQKTGDNRN